MRAALVVHGNCSNTQWPTAIIPNKLRVEGNDSIPVVRIADQAFKDATYITDVAFDKSADGLQIGSNIFAGCTGITKVTVRDVTPASCADDAFDAIGATATLTVPVGSVRAYRKAIGWKKFAKIVNADSDEERDIISGNYKARFNEDFSKLSITGVVNEVEELVIPATLDVEGVQVPVNAVADNAFDGHNYIKRIVIEPGATEITLGKRCFAAIPFTSFEVDRDFIVAGTGAEHPLSTRDINTKATLVVGDNVTKLAENAFCSSYGNQRFTELKLGKNIKSLGEYSIFAFTGLSQLVLPEKLEQIDSYAITDLYVRRVVIPASVKYVRHRAFLRSDRVEVLEFMGGCEGGYAANEILWSTNPLSLKEIILHSATPIAMQYSNSHPVDDANMGNVIVTVPTGSLPAFESATGWKDFDMIVDADGNFHRDGFALRFTNAERTEAVVTGVTDKSVAELTIPETMTKPRGTFSIIGLADRAFNGCENLVTLTCNFTTPPECSDNLFDDFKDRKLIVPVGTVRRYYMTEAWKSWFNTMVDVEDNNERKYVTGPFTMSFDETYSVYSIEDVKIGTDVTELTIPGTLPYYDEQVTVNNICKAMIDVSQLVIGGHTTPLGLGDQVFGRHFIDYVVVDRPVTVDGEGAPFSQLTSSLITFTDNITEIPPRICEGMMRVYDVQLGANVAIVGENAFADTKELNSVCVDAIVPPVCAANAFSGVDLSKVTLTVPVESLTAYRNADIWKDFGSIEGIFTSGEFICQMDTRRGHQNNIKIKRLVNPEAVGETLVIPGKLSHEGQEYTVSMIMNDAFAENRHIKAINILPGDGEIYLDSRCFANVPFTSFTIDRNFSREPGLTKESPFRFDGRVPLAALTLGDNMTEVGSHGFYYAGHRFNKIFMGENITDVGDYSFYSFTNATELKLPANLEHIGDRAFVFCGVKNLVIPASVKSIGKYAFSTMRNMKTLEFEGDSEDLIIGDYAFDVCQDLENVKVKWRSPVEWKSDSSFWRFGIDAVLEVPEGSVAAYANADVWNGFKFITDGTASWPHDVTVNIPGHAAFTVYKQVIPMAVNIKASDNWRIHSLTHNDEDVKEMIDTAGNYTIDGATIDNHRLNVVFEKTPSSVNDKLYGDYSDIRVNTECDGTIRITGVSEDVVAEVYDMLGVCIYSGTERVIRIDNHGTYILRIGKRIFKFTV